MFDLQFNLKGANFWLVLYQTRLNGLSKNQPIGPTAALTTQDVGIVKPYTLHIGVVALYRGAGPDTIAGNSCAR